MATFPKAFEERVLNDSFLGSALLEALNTAAPTALRMHHQKSIKIAEDWKPIPWSKRGYWLAERPIFTLDPHFHAGAYYIQEAGSQFLELVLEQLNLPEEPVVLDLCAAPGGKSTLISSFLNGKGCLVANEVIHQRSRILAENLTKWGESNTIITNSDPQSFGKISSVFDVMVIDAPCSGEGMFRKDHQAREEWSEANVDLCAGRQKRIVADCWESLKPGGFLIYSTCTFNTQENEENIDWICSELGGEELQMSIPFAKKGRNNCGYYALPSELNAEGYFFAVIQKTSGTEHELKKVRTSVVTVDKQQSRWNDWLTIPNHLVLTQFQQWSILFPEKYVLLLQHLLQVCRIVQYGTCVGEESRKGLIPSEQLIFQTHLLNDSVQRIHLNKNEALNYLKGNTFSCDGKQGYAIICFENNQLGWIKHLGNRFNNLYPKEWRIRMNID